MSYWRDTAWISAHAVRLRILRLPPCNEASLHAHMDSSCTLYRPPPTFLTCHVHHQLDLDKNMSFLVFPGGSKDKGSTSNVGDLGSILWLGRFLGEGNGYPLQYSGLENSMDWGSWQATVQELQRVGHNRATFTFTSWVFREIACLPSQYSKM